MSSRPSLWQRVAQVFDRNAKTYPQSIARSKHRISRKDISVNALNVLYRLHKAGYEAYLVGGGVRDLLLGRKPKDFDVVSNARPEQIRKLFSNSRSIGRRFKLIHVFYRDEVIEVSTFRGSTAPGEQKSDVVLHDDNCYGTLEEDVWRRDFTVNALYYNIADFSLMDYTDGLNDIKQKIIKMIGDPERRFQEDPVRMLRAIRFSAKLNFSIQAEIEQLFQSSLPLLKNVSPSRLFDEVLKLFFAGNAQDSYHKLQDYGFLEILFPQLVEALQGPKVEQYKALIEEAMLATDQRYANNQSLNPGFLLSVLLWPSLQKLIHEHPDRRKKTFQVLHYSIGEVLDTQSKSLNTPKRLLAMMRDVWMLQYHLKSRRGKRVYRTLQHRYYRAALDFLMLRAKVGEPVQDLVEWWQTFQLSNEAQQQEMLKSLSKNKS